MKIAVLGSGGREHALAWKFAQSARVHKVFVLPGNPGMREEKIHPLTDSNPYDFSTLAFTLKNLGVSLVIVGPEDLLGKGVVEFLKNEGFKVLGPNSQSSQLEISKSFAKQIMQECQISTPSAHIFDKSNELKSYLRAHTFPAEGVVLKADQLAKGKGVFVCETLEEALDATDRLFNQMISKKVLLEKRIFGEEASLFFLCSEEEALYLGSARDYKRKEDGDYGPNTGGMGAFSPANNVTDLIIDSCLKDIVLPVLKKMKEKEMAYEGFLYVSLMINDEGAHVIEFNVRLGDPETQCLMHVLRCDLVEEVQRVVEGKRFNRDRVSSSKDYSLHVVMTADGYANKENLPHRKGDEIEVLSPLYRMSSQQGKIYYAGVEENPRGKLVSSGGRVLGLTCVGETMEEARDEVYRLLKGIHFSNCFYRKDIGMTKSGLGQ